MIAEFIGQSRFIRIFRGALKFNTNNQIIDLIAGLPVQSSLNIAGVGDNNTFGWGSAASIKTNYSFDGDGNGRISADSDALLILHKLLGAGFDGDALTNRAVAADATRSKSVDVQAWLEWGIKSGVLT